MEASDVQTYEATGNRMSSSLRAAGIADRNC